MTLPKGGFDYVGGPNNEFTLTGFRGAFRILSEHTYIWLARPQAEQLHDALGKWLEESEKK